MSEPGPLLAALPYAEYLGLQIDDTGGLRLPFRDDLLGNVRLGALHGGVVAAALECAALAWLRRHGATARTIDFTVDYLRPAVSRDLHLTATPVRIGRAVATMRVEAWQIDPGRPVAAGHGNFSLSP